MLRRRIPHATLLALLLLPALAGCGDDDGGNASDDHGDDLVDGADPNGEGLPCATGRCAGGTCG